jgi:peroxiredoxin Q/BCP
MSASAKISSRALSVGDKAPSFTAAFDNAQDIGPDSFKGKKVVLYFYPKDDTPGCTIEAREFRDAIGDFKKAGAVVIGVSRDSVESHDQFKEKYCLPFPLASDEDGSVCAAYGVWVKKSMYGKEYMGIERSTFLIDGQGVIRQIWRKVSVTGHVREVLQAVKNL